jgi:hypothetical protein
MHDTPSSCILTRGNVPIYRLHWDRLVHKACLTSTALSAIARHFDADQLHAFVIAGIERIEGDNIDVIATVRQCFRVSLHAAVVDVVGVGDDQDAECAPAETARSDRFRTRRTNRTRQTAQDGAIDLFLHVATASSNGYFADSGSVSNDSLQRSSRHRSVRI